MREFFHAAICPQSFFVLITFQDVFIFLMRYHVTITMILAYIFMWFKFTSVWMNKDNSYSSRHHGYPV